MKINLLLRTAFTLSVLFCFSLSSVSQQIDVKQKSRNDKFLEEWYAGINEAVFAKKYDNKDEDLSESLQPILRSGIQKIITRPDVAYIAGTTKINVSEIAGESMVYSVDGDDFKVTFDAPVKKYNPDAWVEWGNLPDVEDANPHFLWGFYSQLELNLSRPVCVFGMEIATGFYGKYTVSYELYNHSTLIGKITRDIVDVASLFAVEVPAEIPITRVVIKVPWGAYGIGIANIRYSDKCKIAPSGISTQPQSVSVCKGGSHTFMSNGEGEELTYQWYKGNNEIPGANKNTLTITNASYNDYDQYYVVIRDGSYTFISNRVILWVTDPLPAILKFAEFPEPISPGESYPVRLAGYAGVTNYSWDYSNNFAKFAASNTTSNENTLIVSDLARGGVITVELEHVCGNRLMASTVSSKFPMGVENVQSAKVQIYPNPATDMIKVSGCNSEVKLYNATGVLLGTYPANNGTAEIDLSRFVKGVYLVNCDGNTYKIIKK